MHSLLSRILSGIVMLVAFHFAIQFSQSGFNEVQKFKQLERIVPTNILGALNGEVQIQGFSYSLNNQTLTSPKAQVPSLYYRYLEEREERDSDGDTYWVTVTDSIRAVDFVVADRTGEALVRAHTSQNLIKWSLDPSFQKTVGSRRYTEWRIEPEQKVLIFGWASNPSTFSSASKLEIQFNNEGMYVPIISRFDSVTERGSIGLAAILNIWGGISLLALGVCCLMYLLQIHRLLAYLSLLTLLTSVALFSYGYKSLSTTVHEGHDFLMEKQEQAKREMARLAELPSVSSVLGNERQQEIKLNLYFLQQVYLMQISQFPENIFAWVKDLDKPEQAYKLDDQTLNTAVNKLARFEKTAIKETKYYVWAGLGFVMFCALFYLGFRYAKTKRMIENIPTSKSTGVSFGTAEVKGHVALIDDFSLNGPLSSMECIWYRYLVEEKRGSGKDSKWVTISDDTKGIRFHCEDDEGKLLIDADGADVFTKHKKFEKSGSRRFTEWALKRGDELYAIGYAKVDGFTGDQLILGDGDKKSLFILSNYSEEDIMIRKAISSMACLVLAFSGMFLFALFINALNGEFASLDYLLSGLIAPIALTGFMVVLHYNDIVFLSQRAERNWSNIQVSLRKRRNVLKQLQTVLAKYKDHESELFEKIVALRSQLNSSFESAAQASKYIRMEKGVTKGLKLLVEDYPDLKADKLSMEFMQTITKLENEVALMRQGFNDAVNAYNTRIQSFPDLFLAKAFKFESKSRLAL